MIKFFRRIRYNLMKAGETGKYFKYAIGEIILVMLGILLALQVNNWNENRKSHIEIDDLLLDLEEFFNSQKTIMGGEILRIKKTDSVFKLIKEDRLKGTISITPSELQKAFFDPTQFPYIGIPKYQIEFSNIANLINRKEDFPKKYWSMIYDLESLKVYSDEIVYLSGNLSELSKNYLNFLLENKPNLFENNDISYNALKDYILNDATFEIRISEIMAYLDNIINALERYNFNSAKLNGTIKYLIHNNNRKQIDNLWSSYNLVEILTKKCHNDSDKYFNPLSNSYASVLVFNNQNLPVNFEFYNKENDIVKEQTFLMQGVFPLRLRTKEVNTAIRYTIGDKCYVITNPSNNGYLIIN